MYKPFLATNLTMLGLSRDQQVICHLSIVLLNNC